MDGNGAPSLSKLEYAVCDFYNSTLADVRRRELRALYAIGGRLLEHKTAAHEQVRHSLKRLGSRIQKDRTTLLRYAFVYQRIKPDEFERLIDLSDARGFPPSFWDVVEVAKLSRADRLLALVARLTARAKREAFQTSGSG